MARYPDESALHKRYYEEIVEKLKNDPFAQHLGFELIEVGEGRAVAEVTVGEHMLNALGSTHGGVVFSLADFVFAVACNSYGKTSVALQMNIGYLAASFPGQRLRATAMESQKNNRTAWYRITVESDGQAVAQLDALAYRKNAYFVPTDEEEEPNV